MYEYMLDMTKVVIRLKHYGSLHKPITISMQLANDSGHTMFGYSCDYNGQHVPAVLANELIDGCQELAENLLKGSKNV